MYLILIGLVLGRLVFVLSKRILFEEKLWSFKNQCSDCQASCTAKIILPFTSFKCGHCHKSILPKAIFVDIISALIICLVYYKFGRSNSFIPFLALSYFLLAASITDFWTKLIPHDITYPAIIIGIIYSYWVKNDIMSCLAGIGVSYILFDFIAFYGHKLYIFMHKKEIEQILAQNDVSEVSEIEVMGGADAVLSAVIASFLGLNFLVVALMIAFLAGAVLGAVYLFVEMYKLKILNTAIKPVLIAACAIGSIALLIFTGLSFAFSVSIINFIPAITFFVIAGALLGFLFSASSISKPFPFGPAIALGGIITMFLVNV